MRQVVVDTETTGLEPEQGHRIVEIGCVEILDRRVTGAHYHQYVNPKREIDDAAYEIHGLSNRDLEDEPEFEAIAEEFLAFVRGAELVIHNAPFDVAFLNHELSLTDRKERMGDACQILDSLPEVDVFPKYPLRSDCVQGPLACSYNAQLRKNLRLMKLTWTILTASRKGDLYGASWGLLKNPLNRHPTGNPHRECVR